MKRNLYTGKAFVADLIIVTFWAFFCFRTCFWNIWPILVYIPMRIALCFQMHRNSPWTLFSAMAFLFCGSAFAFSDKAIYPFARIVYYIGAWTGNGKAVMDILDAGPAPGMSIWLKISAVLLNLWIFALPLIIGFFQNNIKSINWRHRWIKIYIAVSVIVSVPLFFEALTAGLFVMGFLMCFLPVAYWSRYRLDGRSAFNLLCNYRPLVLYIAFVFLTALCLFIGAGWMTLIIPVALIVAPPVFYALICRSADITPLTRPAAALSASGFLYYFILYSPEWVKIILISVSVILALYAAVGTVKSRGYHMAGLAIFLMPTALVAPLTLGMNPYAVLDTDSVSWYHYGYVADDGFFIIEKNGRIGLRDRFGLVLEPVYIKFERLCSNDRYLITNLGDGRDKANNRYGIFDTRKYEFFVDPKAVDLIDIMQTGKLSFRLTRRDGTAMGTLQLPGYHPEIEDYVREAHIEPTETPAELTLEENDEWGEIAETLDDAQQGTNAGAYMLQDKARAAVNRKFNEIIEQDSTYRDVYDRWSDLMEAMSGYLVDVTYGKPWYSMQPLQYSGDIRRWYETLLPEVAIDKDIIFGKLKYASPKSGHVIDVDIDDFFLHFEPTRPGGYDRMWNEIRPAFLKWQEARARYAGSLHPEELEAYQEHTAYLTDYYFKEIKDLIICRNDNIR